MSEYILGREDIIEIRCTSSTTSTSIKILEAFEKAIVAHFDDLCDAAAEYLDHEHEDENFDIKTEIAILLKVVQTSTKILCIEE